MSVGFASLPLLVRCYFLLSITEKDKKPEFICIVRVKFKPARGCAYIYILSKLQSAAFIHFKVQFFAVLNTESRHYAYEVDEGKLKWPFHEKNKTVI